MNFNTYSEICMYISILTRWQKDKRRCRVVSEAHAKPARVPHVQRAKEQLKRTVRTIGRKILWPRQNKRTTTSGSPEAQNHCNGFALARFVLLGQSCVFECVSISVTWSMTNRWNVQCKNFTQRTRELWVEFKTVWERKRERKREAGGRWLCGACLNLYSDASCLAGLALSGFLVNFRACLPACSCTLGWLPLWEREVLLVSLPCAPLT